MVHSHMNPRFYKYLMYTFVLKKKKVLIKSLIFFHNLSNLFFTDASPTSKRTQGWNRYVSTIHRKICIRIVTVHCIRCTICIIIDARRVDISFKIIIYLIFIYIDHFLLRKKSYGRKSHNKSRQTNKNLVDSKELGPNFV
jgi:hypothetical protein